MKRQFDPSQPELMDQAELIDGKPTAELERDLANLRWLNSRFGAHALLRHFLKRWLSVPPSSVSIFRVLDLATGEGDLPREIVSWCRKRKIPILIDAVDQNAATLAVATERSREFPEIRFHRGDIRFWGEGAWDLVLCSLALHHFSNEDAVTVLRNARRLSSRHLLVADLKRNFLGAAGIWLLTSLLLREPMTVHDARLSIRRAFSFRELGNLAREAGWKSFGQRSFPVTRQALWMDSNTRDAVTNQRLAGADRNVRSTVPTGLVTRESPSSTARQRPGQQT
jgi:SAM-dependent methyltransferase